MNIHTEESWINWIDQLAENDFVVMDDFLSPVLDGKVKSFFQTKLDENEFERAGLGSVFHKYVDINLRGDFTYWIDKKEDPLMAEMFVLIEEMKAALNRLCFLSLSGYEFHLAHYPIGTFYKRHLDQFKTKNNRMISVIIYLNEGWKKENGGELKIYKDAGNIVIQPISSRCVLFKSAIIPHEVLKTNVARNSLTGWLLFEPLGLGVLSN